MRKYIKPEVEITAFDVEDVVMTSSVFNEPQNSMNIEGNTVLFSDYGAQDFSIFE